MSIYFGLFVRLFCAINKTIPPELDKGSRFQTLANESTFIKYIDNINLSGILRVLAKDNRVLSYKSLTCSGYHPIDKAEEKDFEKMSRSSNHALIEKLIESARLSDSQYTHVELLEKFLSVTFLTNVHTRDNYTIIDISRSRLVRIPSTENEQRNYIINFLESLDINTAFFQNELDRFVIQCSRIFTRPLSLPDNTTSPTIEDLKKYCTLIEMKEISA